MQSILSFPSTLNFLSCDAALLFQKSLQILSFVKRQTDDVVVAKLDTQFAFRILKVNVLELFSGASRKQNSCHTAGLLLTALFVVALFYTSKHQSEETLL